MKAARFAVLSSFLLLVAGAGVLLDYPEAIEGQQRFPESNRKPACGCYVCGKLDPVQFPNRAADCAGILAEDACPVQMRSMPGESRSSFCQAIKAKFKVTSFKDSCPIFAEMCEKESGPSGGRSDCQTPTPWFDGSKKCGDIQTTQAKIVGNSVEVSVCGAQVFRGTVPSPDRLALQAYQTTLLGEFKSAIGEKVCCDTFRGASSGSSGCDPGNDLDCDGVPNQTDTRIDGSGIIYPNLSPNYATAPGARVAPFPPGLDPNSPDFRPERTAQNSTGVGECSCKWVLTKGEQKCAEGKMTYVANWKCPSSGAEVFTTTPTSVACSR